MAKKWKKCIKCKQHKESINFHVNNALKDGLSRYCKKCLMDQSLSDRGTNGDLTVAEESLLLKYLPYSHDKTHFICKNPQAVGVDEAEPFTIAEVARDNNLCYSEVQRIFYKFTRMRLTVMVIKGDHEGKAEFNIVYKPECIRDHVLNV